VADGKASSRVDSASDSAGASVSGRLFEDKTLYPVEELSHLTMLSFSLFAIFALRGSCCWRIRNSVPSVMRHHVRL